jgi:CRP/FNR family cyclic AMP-dependent transcriptional regulator
LGGHRRDARALDRAGPNRQGGTTDYAPWEELIMYEFLRQIPLFAGLGEAELQVLAEAATEKHYPKNSPIIHKDEPGTSLFIVRSGIVDVSAESPHGQAVHLASFQTGEFFGEMALFDGRPRSATVMAHEDATVIEISRASFMKLMFRHPDMTLKIMAEISNRFRNTDEIVREYSDRIYREASSSLDKVLRTELESAKTIYGNRVHLRKGGHREKA